MKVIILIDWSDDQSKMPQQPNCSKEGLLRSRRIMKSFEFWRRKQNRAYQLVLWHTHFPGRFTPPEERPLPPDCRANLLEKQIEAVAKNYSPNEPLFLADNSFMFTDDFDLEPFIEQAMRPGIGVVPAQNALILNPNVQRLWGGIDAEPNGKRFETDWTVEDFRDWISRTTWTFAKTYADTSPHEYAVLGKPNTELADLYQATMFILRNGFVLMYYTTPFMVYEIDNRRYWSYISYGLVNRSLEGDLKTYQ